MKLEICGDSISIKNAFCSGVKGIFTAHGDCFEGIKANSELHDLITSYQIEKIIFLDKNIKGKIFEIYELDKNEKKYKKLVIK